MLSDEVKKSRGIRRDGNEQDWRMQILRSD